jgi:hypothetical protein
MSQSIDDSNQYSLREGRYDLNIARLVAFARVTQRPASHGPLDD